MLVRIVGVSLGAAVVLGLTLSTLRAGQVMGTNGAELFVNYCASCHGRDGKTAGPTSVALKFKVPDLTTIARRNGGTFPTERMKLLIWGPENLFIPAHGSSQMPIWGPTFRALDPNGDDARRLAQIVTYLESLQVK